jgi:hypothetical protein
MERTSSEPFTTIRKQEPMLQEIKIERPTEQEPAKVPRQILRYPWP